MFLAAVQTAAQPAAELPFELPVPEGWRTETIPFPLSFAPELAYEGLEELRFAPGMFEQAAPDFWTYAFIWWVDIDSEINAEALGTDLRAYFVGLAKAVAESRELDPGDLDEVDLQFKVSPAAAPWQQGFEGAGQTYDAFVTQGPLELRLLVHARPCVKAGRLAVIFEISPQPQDHPVWDTLRGIRHGFACSAASS